MKRSSYKFRKTCRKIPVTCPFSKVTVCSFTRKGRHLLISCKLCNLFQIIYYYNVSSGATLTHFLPMHPLSIP